MQFMPHFAPFVVLAFLGSCFVLAVGAALFLFGLLRRRHGLTKWAGLGASAVACGYLVLLLGASVTSEEKDLTPGARKYFCEIDCHIANSIESVASTRVVGAAPQQVTASGTFYIVKVKTLFDENTISNHRGNGPLWPNPRRVVIVDDQGKEYGVAASPTEALQHAEPNWTPLTQPLRPGESYTTDLVFDLPEGVRNPRLFITNDDAVTALLIGHENSPLHKRIYFRLEPKPSSASL